MSILLGIAVALLIAGAVAMAAPVSVRYESRDRKLAVRWLGLSLGGKPRAPKPVEERPRKERGAVLLNLLWEEPDLRRGVVRLLRGLARVTSLKGTEVSVSLPDPMWNGVLYGVLAAVPLGEARVTANFVNENRATLVASVRPYRAVWVVGATLVRLPVVRIARSLRRHRRHARAAQAAA